jgi:putative lipase involved disintegration of autophagic bodies
LDWDEEVVLVPDTRDRDTVLELAKLAGNAYQLPGAKNWYDVHERWNTSIPFGWGDGDDGLRGNVFATPDNSTVILSIKGTTLWGGGNTSRRDKLNDNLLFSCCCGRVGWGWAGSRVCDCYNGRWTCDNSCIERSLVEDSLFYSVGVNLYNNLTYMYPEADIWIVGHSLGGALASLLGATFGAPTVTFEAPGERLAARRLHLPESPGHLPITHIYHTGDPVPLGTCTGMSSICAKAGYAMESHCHLGKSIVYDTVTKWGWKTHLGNHPIAVIITSVLAEDWEEDRPVPEAMAEVDCIDCYKWEFA